jgi:hypothetical protein
LKNSSCPDRAVALSELSTFKKTHQLKLCPSYWVVAHDQEQRKTNQILTHNQLNYFT